MSEIESSLAFENENVMGAVIVVEVEAAGTAATSTDGHRVTRDLLHQDVGETMTTIADHHHREPQIRMFQPKQGTTIDRHVGAVRLPQAAHLPLSHDADVAIRLLKVPEVRHGGDGVTAAMAALVLALARVIVAPIVETGSMMRSAADRLHLSADAAHHHLGATAADHLPLEAVLRL